jgi:hypothetical protein
VQAFNLTGAHTEVECKECHNDPELQYGEAPTDCVSCHVQPMMQTQFGTDCQRCHTMDAWAPARLTQHTFDLKHANSIETECQDCHKITYAAVDCTGCHTEGGRVEAEHSVIGIVDSGDCAGCHPTGMAGEAHLAVNFPAKVGTPPGSATQGDGGAGQVDGTTQPSSSGGVQGTTQPSSGVIQDAMQPSAEPTFASKDASQGPFKEQDGGEIEP